MPYGIVGGLMPEKRRPPGPPMGPARGEAHCHARSPLISPIAFKEP